MRTEDLAYFQSPLLPGEDIRFHGEFENDHMQDGLLCAGGLVVGYVEHGVVSLVEPYRNWPREALARLEEGDWIRNNWRQLNLFPFGYRDECDTFLHELLATEGAILDFASGPGGGFVPFLVTNQPERPVIITDLSARVLMLHREYVIAEGIPNDLRYVAVDLRNGSIRPGSVDVITSVGGVGEISPPGEAARSVARMLVPGGRIFACEGAFREDELDALPDDVRHKHGIARKNSPHRWLADAGLDVTFEALFSANTIEEMGRLELARDALDAGVILHLDYHLYIARKPE